MVCPSLWAVHEDAGTTGFNTLKLIYSARATAMGQAHTSIIRNPDGIQFNPATLLLVAQKEASSTYMNYFLDTQGGGLQIALPKDKFTAYAVGINFIDFGSIDRTDVDSNGELIESGESFGAYNMILSASLAKQLNDVVDFGASLKAVYDKIDANTASALMLDAGLIHHPENERIKVGLSMRNLGKQLSFYTDNDYEEQLPLTFAFGFSYAASSKSQLSIDINKATGQAFIGKFGVEYLPLSSVALRGGFRTDAADWKPSGGWGLSGLSLGAGWSWQDYVIDYAIASYGDLGFVNQLTLKYKF